MKEDAAFLIGLLLVVLAIGAFVDWMYSIDEDSWTQVDDHCYVKEHESADFWLPFSNHHITRQTYCEEAR